MGMIVLVRGSLKGMNRVADCEVVAMKRTIVSTRKSHDHYDEVYSEFAIVEAPPDLPDGDYIVRVGRQTLSVHLCRGLWLNCCELSSKSAVS